MDALGITRLDIRHLVTFATVARCGSFTEGAARLGYTQSAISGHVQRLEALVGARLIDRGSGVRGVRLTPAGQVVLRHAEALLVDLERAAADIGALARGGGLVRLGFFESVAASVIGPLLTDLAEHAPDLTVTLTELDDDAGLLGLVEAEQLDLSAAVLPLPDGPFVATVLLRDPYVLVTSPDAAWAPPPGPTALADHLDIPLMSYGTLRGPHSLERRSGHPEYARHVVFRSNHNATLLDLAEHGHAAAVLSRLALAGRPPRHLAVHALTDLPPREIALVHHRDRPPTDATLRVIEAARALSVQVQALLEAD